MAGAPPPQQQQQPAGLVWFEKHLHLCHSHLKGYFFPPRFMDAAVAGAGGWVSRLQERNINGDNNMN